MVIAAAGTAVYTKYKYTNYRRIIQVRKSNKNNLKTVPAFVTDIEAGGQPENVIHKFCRIWE